MRSRIVTGLHGATCKLCEAYIPPFATHECAKDDEPETPGDIVRLQGHGAFRGVIHVDLVADRKIVLRKGDVFHMDIDVNAEES